ncbi:hypothetical protein AmDm5_2182 [Acetobacter malorum]|nr:hypothetical protein AmDm5_2182 [Acetobacter malorum]
MFKGRYNRTPCIQKVSILSGGRTFHYKIKGADCAATPVSARLSGAKKTARF